MEKGTRFGFVALLVILGFFLIWGLDGPQGIGDPQSMVAALWVRGEQAGDERFLLKGPLVALYGTGRVVAVRERRWFEGVVSRADVQAFLTHMAGAGLRSLPEEVHVLPEDVGATVFDGGETHVRIAIDGMHRDIFSKVPLPTLRERRGLSTQVDAAAEAIGALRSLAARADRYYEGPITLSVRRLDDPPDGVSPATWPAEPGVRALADYEAPPAETEIYFEESARLLRLLFDHRYFREAEFLYRVDWRPILPQRPDR